MKKTDDVDKYHGYRLRYANPFNGGWSSPTMGAHLSLLPKGFKGAAYRSTDGTIFACLEGKGQTKVDGEDPSNGARATCSWCRPGSLFAHGRRPEAVLFSISDRPMQEALGIWREGN